MKRAPSPGPPPGPAPDGPVDYDVLPRLVGYHLRRAHSRFSSEWLRAMGDLGLSPALAAILILIEKNPGLSQTRLAQALDIEPPSLVEVLDKLVGRGLIERSPSPMDRRVRFIHLTPEGGRVTTRMRRAIKVHERRLTAGLSSAEVRQLTDLLGKLWVPADGRA